MRHAWKDIDWRAGKPGESEIQLSWQKMRFEPFDVDGDAAEQVREALGRVFRHGGVQLKGFALVAQDEAMHWFLSRNRLGEYEFFRVFLASDAVRAGLPDLQLDDGLSRLPEFREIWSGTLTLDGELATHLTKDGAYADGRFTGTAQEAKELTTRFVAELTGNAHENFLVYRSYHAWSPWFRDVAWDRTYVIIDLARNRIVILAMTDTD